jgi:hypothetical protein
MLTVKQIAARVESLKHRARERDSRQEDVLAVRRGNIASVYPDFFPDGVDANVVANFIDIVARDLSEVMAPLPTINCSSINKVEDKSRKFADRRTQIAANYFINSDLQVQMYTGADWYITFGFVPFIVEFDEEAGLPRIRIENPVGAYPEYDRYGRCIAFAKKYRMTIAELVAQFPEHEAGILGDDGYDQDVNAYLTVIRYYDKEQSVIYIPERGNYPVSIAENPTKKMLVHIARKPSVDGEMRGQFDDVLGIQLLRNRFALLAMEAAEKSVQSPIVLPSDVQEFEFGGDGVIRTNNPAGVRRVELPIPAGAFSEQQVLQSELRTGTRYPESRTGNVDASIITGQGVQALMGGFDTQIKSAQAIFASTLKNVITTCFEVDEIVFDYKKTIRGVDAGAPYALEYVPSKDIKGDYSADVRYGMLAGLNPAQGLIFMLQALGGDLISVDLAQREMPFGINVTQEQEKIEVEKLRKALIGSLQAYTQTIPQMASQGQDPLPVIQKIAMAIKGRKAGKSIEDVIEEVFTPENPPAGSPVEQPVPSAPGAPAGGAPAQPGRPDLQMLLSRLNTSGEASGSVQTQQQRII